MCVCKRKKPDTGPHSALFPKPCSTSQLKASWCVCLSKVLTQPRFVCEQLHQFLEIVRWNNSATTCSSFFELKRTSFNAVSENKTEFCGQNFYKFINFVLSSVSELFDWIKCVPERLDSTHNACLFLFRSSQSQLPTPW